MNGLFNNWSVSSPGKDTVLQTQNPALVHFTTRYYAFTPMRIHNFQISVRRQPEQFIPIQFGQVTKYLNDKGILVDVWVLTGTQQTVEQAEVTWYSMMQEVKRIIRVNGTQFGSGIQAVLLGRTIHDEAAMDAASPKFHAVISCKAKLYETATS